MKNIYLEIVNKAIENNASRELPVLKSIIESNLTDDQKMDIMLCQGVRIIDGKPERSEWIQNGDWIIDPQLCDIEVIDCKGVINVEFDNRVQYFAETKRA